MARAGADAARQRSGRVSQSMTPGSRATPRPRKTTPAHGRSGRQSSVFGSASPSPSHRSQGGSNKVERMKNGAAIAAKPIARLAQAGAVTNGAARRLATAMQWRMPKVMGSLGAKTKLPAVTSAAAPATIASAAPEGPQVQPVAMGERQRHANQERGTRSPRCATRAASAA